MSVEQEYIQPGSIVGPYRIVRGFKGRGGMASILEVEVREKYRQSGYPRRLALKVAKEEHQPALVAEADFLRRFDHPNVVRIFPLPRGEEHRPVYAARERFPFGWGWYYTMEMVDGGSLERQMVRPTTITDLLRPPVEGMRRLNILMAVGITRQLAAALEHIHEQYVVNLDVKPGNVLFRRRQFRYLRGTIPQAVLCDFGIARDLRYPRAGLLGVATPEYVSPEQLSELDPDRRRHRPVDVRSDIFSLGVVLYEMLTGQLPFENVALTADPTYAPTPPSQHRRSIPPMLEDIIMRAMAKEPAYRFQTAAEMRAALDRVSTPLDWSAAARRTAAGVTVTACLFAGGWGIDRITSFISPTQTSTPTPTTPPPVTRSVTPTPTPRTPTPTQTPTVGISPTKTPRVATSTPAPTSTPSPTYIPRPPTPTPEGG